MEELTFKDIKAGSEQKAELKHQPKISVIVPVYNPGERLSQCLKSLQNQTLQDIEMLFIDDCCTDGSMELIREAEKTDSRIRILTNPENLGAGISRNLGIEHAKGNYLSFVDADDYISEDFLELLWKKTRKKKPDIVKGERIHADREGNKLQYQGGRPLNLVINAGLAKKIPLYVLFDYNHWTAIYRRSYILRCGARYGTSRNSQDTTFLLRACWSASRICFEDRAVYCYTARDHSRMRDFSGRRFQEEMKAFQEQIRFLTDHYEDSDHQVRYVNNRIGYLLRLQAHALQIEGLRETAEGFLEELRKYVLQLPYAQGLRNKYIKMRLFLDLGANLSMLPYRAQGQDPPVESGLEVVRRWTDFICSYPEYIDDLRADLQEVYRKVLRNHWEDQATTLTEKIRLFYVMKSESARLPQRKLLTKGDPLLGLYLKTGINFYKKDNRIKSWFLHVIYPKLR